MVPVSEGVRVAVDRSVRPCDFLKTAIDLGVEHLPYVIETMELMPHI